MTPVLQAMYEDHKSRRARLFGVSKPAKPEPAKEVPPREKVIVLAPEPQIDVPPIPHWLAKPTIPLIIGIVARRYGLSENDLIGRTRRGKFIEPRHLAMYLSQKMTKNSLPEIGRRSGNRDHTTVLHGIRKTEARIASDHEFAARVESIMSEIEFAYMHGREAA